MSGYSSVDKYELLMRLRALEAIPTYSMSAMASIVTEESLRLVRLISDRGNPKNTFKTREVYTDKRVLGLCETIRSLSYKYYDKLSDLLARLNNKPNFIGNTDAYEGMALSTEQALEIICPKLDKVRQALKGELLKVCAPQDKNLFLSVMGLLFISQLFVNYRSTFKNLEEIDTFRALRLHPHLLDLANALKMKNSNGKTLRLLYTPEEKELWRSLSNRRSYKGIKVSEQHFIDVRAAFSAESVDRASFECVKELFCYKNIDKIVAAGDNGKSPRFSEMFSAPYYFGSMECYEQFSFTTAMLRKDYQTAKVYLADLRRIYPDARFVFGLSVINGRGTFKGIWPSPKAAADENMVKEETVVKCAETNLTIKTKTEIRMDMNHCAYFWVDIIDEIIKQNT